MRYSTAAYLVETHYRVLADNSVGRVIDTLLRNDLVLATSSGSHGSMTPAPSCCSGSSPPRTNAGHSASASHWPFEYWGRFLPEHTTAV